jgi:hypothetical protein
MCPPKEALEVEITSSNTLPSKPGEKIVQAGINILKCKGDTCAGTAEIDKAVDSMMVKMQLF